MTNRRKPAQRPTGAEWKPGRPRQELLKAIGGASAVVLLTALVIFVIKPADSPSTPDTSVPAATTPTQPASSTTTATQP